MNKFLGLGILLAIISPIIGFATSDWMLVLKVSGVVVLIPLLLAGLFTGAFAGGDRVRANYDSESKESREERMQWVKSFVLIALPNVIFILILLVVDYFITL